MQTPEQNAFFETASAPSVKIFGVGNAGDALLNALATAEFSGAEFAAINTDAAALAASSATVKIHLENKLFRGLGSGGDPERGRALAEEQFSTLKSACAGANVIFILAGLGGGAGSGISPVLAKAAREAGALVLAFVTLPFDCEGNRRETQAQASLEQLKSAADGVVCLPSQKIFKLIDENSTLVETFRVTGGFLIEGVRGVWSLLTRPGLIQVHFGDLCALLRDRHAENAFAFVEASGAGRAREVVEKILTHPLLDEGRAGEFDGGQRFDDGRDQPRDGIGQTPVRPRADHHGRGGGRGLEGKTLRDRHRRKTARAAGQRDAAHGNPHDCSGRRRSARSGGGASTATPRWLQAGAAATAADDRFQGPFRQKRADAASRRGFGRADVHPARHRAELILS